MQQSNFPLDSFFAALRTDGFQLSERDYARIRLILQTDGDWSIEQLRDTLMFLLATDVEKQERFIRRFDEFFDPHLHTAPLPPDTDMHQVLADLHRYAGRRQKIARSQPTRRFSRPQVSLPPIKLPSSISLRFRVWMLLPTALVLMIVATVVVLLQPGAEPSLSVSTSQLHFPGQLVGESRSQQITITNLHDAELALDVSLDADTDSPFGMDGPEPPISILPRESITLTVSFAPTMAVSSTDQIRIMPDSGDLLLVDLVGNGIARRNEAAGGSTRVYNEVPTVVINETELSTPTIWPRYLALSVLFLALAALYTVYIWRSHRIPDDNAASWRTDGPRLFRLGVIGGRPAPVLDEDTIRDIADSIGYFQSDVSGHRLNVAASIQTTVRQGGIPVLQFHRRAQVRSLLILEDAKAESASWNSAAQDLAHGLERHGVPVLFGRFNGVPNHFTTADGVLHHMEDLEDQRKGFLVLVFSDSRGIFGRRGMLSLESLASWPMAAWMELREPRFWDELSALPAEYGIPVYPATATGTLDAVRHFITEQGNGSDYANVTERSLLLTHGADVRLDVQVEKLLGDALPWAQACAMIQPLSLGLADKLRREQFPYLPPEHVGRLCALPGTQRNVAGLRFSNEVLRILRTGFLTGQSDAEQEACLHLILAEIETAEPDQEGSLAHLAWEAVRERVRLELFKDNDLQRLAELARSPVGDAISSSLEDFGFSDQADRIPLRIRPRDKHALQRLARIAENLEIPRLESFPVTRGQWATLGGLLSAFLICVVVSVVQFLQPRPAMLELGLGLNSAFAPVLLERKDEDGAWQAEALTLPKHALNPKDEYRLYLYSGGLSAVVDSFSPSADHSMQVSLDFAETRTEFRSCREEIPGLRLTILRCPTANAMTGEVAIAPWREQVGAEEADERLWSVGLVIVDTPGPIPPDVLGLQDLLLTSGSVDLMLFFKPDATFGVDDLMEALHTMPVHFWAAQSQLLWWYVGPDKNRIETEEKLKATANSFGASLDLGQGPSRWFENIAMRRTPEHNRLIDVGMIADSIGVDLDILRYHGRPLLVSPVRGSPGWGYAERVETEDVALVRSSVRSGILQQTLRHEGPVRSGAWSPDGSRIVTASDDNTARVLDVQSGRELLTLRDHASAVLSAAYSPDGSRIFVARGDTVSVLDSESGSALFTYVPPRRNVNSASWSPNGSRIVVAGGDTASVLDSESGSVLFTYTHPRRNVNSASWSPDGSRIVVAGGDTASVLDSQSSRTLLTFRLTGDRSLASWSPDGSRIVTASDDNTVKVWDLTGRELLSLSGHTDSVLSAAYSPDGSRIVTASDDTTAKVWDAASGGELLTLSGHSGSVLSAAWSPDGSRIVTASSDNTAQVWDAATGELLFLLQGHSDAVASALFSPDGEFVVTASLDGTARVWRFGGDSRDDVALTDERGSDPSDLSDAIARASEEEIAAVAIKGSHCFRTDGNASADDIDDARNEALYRAVVSYDSTLEEFSRSEVLPLAREVVFTTGILPDTNVYCVDVTASILYSDVSTLLGSSRMWGRPTTARVELINAAYLPDRDAFELAMSIDHPSRLYEVYVSIWDVRGGNNVSGDRIYPNPKSAIVAEISTRSLEPEREYSIRVRAVDFNRNLVQLPREHENDRLETILAEHRFTYRPPVVEPAEFTIQWVRAPVDSPAIEINLNAPAPRAGEQYEGFIVEKETGVLVGNSFGPSPFRGNRIEIWRPTGFAPTTVPQEFVLTLYILTPPHVDREQGMIRSEAVTYEFTLGAVAPPTFMERLNDSWSRIWAALEDNPIILIAVLFVIFMVTGWFLFTGRSRT